MQSTLTVSLSRRHTGMDGNGQTFRVHFVTIIVNTCIITTIGMFIIIITIITTSAVTSTCTNLKLCRFDGCIHVRVGRGMGMVRSSRHSTTITCTTGGSMKIQINGNQSA